jgi:hypothetical protein
MKQVYHSRRHREPHQQEKSRQEQPFFAKTRKKDPSAFFGSAPVPAPVQTKLAIGQPGGKYEREADAVAARVVDGSNQGAASPQRVSSIQRQSSPKEEKEPSTAEGRMEQDKLVQPQAKGGASGEAPKKEEKKPVQTKSDPAGMPAEKEKKTPVQPKSESTPAAGEKEEKKPVQTKSAGKIPGKEEKPPIQRAVAKAAPEEEKKAQAKADPSTTSHRASKADPGSASTSLSDRIGNSSGKGALLPARTRAEMEAAFGRDFSDVNIHTDREAARMNEELGAQAFTHGRDVYFNSGKYQPDSAQGKRLLAHELTHVLQQRGSELVSADRSSDESETPGAVFDGTVSAREALRAVGGAAEADQHADATLAQMLAEINGKNFPRMGAIFERGGCAFEVVASNEQQGLLDVRITKHK